MTPKDLLDIIPVTAKRLGIEEEKLKLIIKIELIGKFYFF